MWLFLDTLEVVWKQNKTKQKNPVLYFFFIIKGENLPNLELSPGTHLSCFLILSNTLSSYEGVASTKLSVRNILWLDKHCILFCYDPKLNLECVK